MIRRIRWFLLGLLALLFGPLFLPNRPARGARSARELAQPDSHFIEIDGVDVHYQDVGQGEPALVLLHGFAASTFTWHRVIEPLSRFGRVVAYDRPGQGLTSRPSAGQWSGPGPYSVETQPDLLIGLLDQLGIAKAVLVGNSAGGAVALLTALKYPHRVTKLVLVDAAVYSMGPRLPGWARWLLSTPQAMRLGPWLLRTLAPHGMGLLERAWHDPSRIPSEVYEGYRRTTLSVAGWERGIWELTRAPRAVDLPARLPEVRLPVLVLTGDDDRIVPTAESIRLGAAIPGAKLVVVPGCGHMPQEERPDAFMKAVEQFLRESKNARR